MDNQHHIDRILDRINKIGYNKLTDLEKEYLRTLDKPDLDKKVEEKSDIFRSKNIPDLIFVFNSTERLKNATLHTGMIYYKDNKYWGFIEVDNKGNVDASFIESTDDESSVSIYDVIYDSEVFYQFIFDIQKELGKR